jgi:GAF domain-containing protein
MAHASEQMPYFIKPSLNLSDQAKTEAYQNVQSELSLLLGDEQDILVIMASINCILKSHLPYFYWVGFYIAHGDLLKVGPYQGTLGCIDIAIGRGVCGRVAQSRETIIVDDVHALVQGADHIACDPNSHSEIVLPVFNSEGALIAVFDVDSTLKSSFNHIDQENLEQLLRQFFTERTLTSVFA